MISLATSILMLLLDLLGVLNAYVMSLMLVLFATGFLTMTVNALALTLDPHPKIAGFVSSLVESSSRIFASVLAILLVWLIGGKLVCFLWVFFIVAVAVLGLIFLGQRRISVTNPA